MIIVKTECLHNNRKKDDRLDWMYQGAAGQVSRDEYLMGRAIDKQITDQYEEPESGPSMETGLLPGSIFNPVTPASTQDMAAKIREDPLFEIRSAHPRLVPDDGCVSLRAVRNVLLFFFLP